MLVGVAFRLVQVMVGGVKQHQAVMHQIRQLAAGTCATKPATSRLEPPSDSETLGRPLRQAARRLITLRSRRSLSSHSRAVTW